jgi:hypothetical protein
LESNEIVPEEKAGKILFNEAVELKKIFSAIEGKSK